MELKYDSYYEKDLPYKMTMEELVAMDYMSDEAILAYIRYVGVEKFRIMLNVPVEFIRVPFMGNACLVSSSGKSSMELCRMYVDEENNPSYNPLNERPTLGEDNWYHPYKIMFIPVHFDGCVEKKYFGDFCASVRRGRIEIVEME